LSCCDRPFPCRYCHDEETGHSSPPLPKITELMCMKCKTIQGWTQYCIKPSCKQQFGTYFCKPCFQCNDLTDSHHCSVTGQCSTISKEDCDECGTGRSSSYSSSSYSSSSRSYSPPRVPKSKPAPKVKSTCPNCKGKGYWVGTTNKQNHNRCLKCGGSGIC
jgi:hypothetical protein